ncbi:hypothetical protein ACSTS3_17300 [Aquimarina muelleri]|uniref:hypothetical protein n=1 Tax=Aquimarina muelleri TaxID=279356 RepID=UPI003F689244
MIINTKEEYLKIQLLNQKELQLFRRGILGILSKVEIDSKDETLTEYLKNVYKLLDCMSVIKQSV